MKNKNYMIILINVEYILDKVEYFFFMKIIKLDIEKCILI